MHVTCLGKKKKNNTKRWKHCAQLYFLNVKIPPNVARSRFITLLGFFLSYRFFFRLKSCIFVVLIFSLSSSHSLLTWKIPTPSELGHSMALTWIKLWVHFVFCNSHGRLHRLIVFLDDRFVAWGQGKEKWHFFPFSLLCVKWLHLVCACQMALWFFFSPIFFNHIISS